MKKSVSGLMVAFGALVTAALVINGCMSASKNDGGNRVVASGEETKVIWPMLSAKDLALASKIAYTQHTFAVQHIKKENLDDIKIEKLTDSYKIALATQAELDQEEVIKTKVEEFFTEVKNNPVVNNSLSDRPVPSVGRLDAVASEPRKEIRVTSWNVERGEELKKIKEMMSYNKGGLCDRDRIKSGLNLFANKGDKKIDPETEKVAIDEVCALNETDVLIVNEADYKTCRSGYKFVADDLARHLKMNFVYAPSFIEIEPHKTGLTDYKEDEKCADKYDATLASEQRNLTGNAILSKYEIKNVQVIELPVGPVDRNGVRSDKQKRGFFTRVLDSFRPRQKDTNCWNWHDDEIKSPTIVDKGMHIAVDKIFHERIKREMRFGQRNAIAIDLDLGDGKIVTVVDAHLENKAKPECRAAQMNFLLDAVKARHGENDKHPIILGGDLNTTGRDGSSQSVAGTAWEMALNQTVKSHTFWQNIVGVTAPTGVNQGYSAFKFTFGYLTTTQNPTRVNLPGLRPSPEGYLFQRLRDDGFISKGDESVTVDHNNQGYWSATNSRDTLGFEASHYVRRPILTWGKSRLDWLLVNPNGESCIRPRFARTLNRMRDGIGEKEFPSDHAPITMMYGYDPACMKRN